MGYRIWRSNAPVVSVDGKKGFFDVTYGKDSELQKLDVWLPEGEGPFPAIISIHGGGYVACDKRYGEMILPWLSGIDKGFAVIGVNYRLAPTDKYPKQIQDIKQAIRYIKSHSEEFNVDQNKLIVWGGSAGGYLTLMACLCDDVKMYDNPNDDNLNVSAKVAGGIAWYPQTDFTTSDYELQTNSIIKSFLKPEELDVSDEYCKAFPLSKDSDFPFHNAEDSVVTMFLGEVPTSEKGKEASPINHIHKNMPPILVQHGSADEILPMQQSIAFALKANEICGEERVKLEIIPNAIHSSLLFETEKNLDKIYDFINEIVLKKNEDN